MKMPLKTSIKHLQNTEANNMMLIVVALASMVIAFSLLSSKALLSQSGFQHKVLKEKNKAIADLKRNIDSANTLKTQYDVFEKQNPNIIGGQGNINTTANGPSDGDNARIVGDSLPSQYDFPALTSSLEKIVDNDHLAVQGIGATDNGQTLGSTADSTAGTSTSSTSGQSQAQPIAFSITVHTDYNTGLTLIKDFERSIRPVDISSLSLSGSSNNMNLSIQANTYFQPGVTLQIGQKVVNQ